MAPAYGAWWSRRFGDRNLTVQFSGTGMGHPNPESRLADRSAHFLERSRPLHPAPVPHRFLPAFSAVPTERSMSHVREMDLPLPTSFGFRRLSQPRSPAPEALPRPPPLAYPSCGPSSCACRCCVPERRRTPDAIFCLSVSIKSLVRLRDFPLAQPVHLNPVPWTVD